jgi:hypothetical protein
MEVFMPSDTLPDLSPEQKLARKLAARELAKYCQEFSRWRKTKQGSAALNNSLPAQGTLGPIPMKEPDSPAPHSSA